MTAPFLIMKFSTVPAMIKMYQQISHKHNMMKQILCTLLVFMSTMGMAHAQSSSYRGLAETFYKALGDRDFTRAYSLCKGARWGTPEQFASVAMYGGIHEVHIRDIKYENDTHGNQANVSLTADVRDSVNGDGIYVQQFALKKQADNTWKITDITLLKTNRAQNGWNLKLIDQPGLTLREVSRRLKPVYDTVGNEPQTENSADTIERTITGLHFYQAPTGIYAVAVVASQGPGYGVSVGWCDLFVFAKRQDKWVMTDVSLEAGGGGMYGYSGQFEQLIQVGVNTVGVVISGGQTHMGALFHNDIIAITEGQLKHLVSVHTHSSYGDLEGKSDGYKKCLNNNYRFLKSEKDLYDLQIIRTDCLDGKKEKQLEKVIIPATKGTYKIPAAFIFEG